jgi:CRP-like cAMP-binding protein
MNTLYGFLKSVDIFSLLSEKEIDEIRVHLEDLNVDAGSVLFRQGDEGNELYIVRRGSVATSIALPDGTNRR